MPASHAARLLAVQEHLSLIRRQRTMKPEMGALPLSSNQQKK
uniref:Uncharacterized protein n=1 Tax=Arundo donax TaxID=35708 RepID=A0A0A9IGS0_ARUDO